METNITTRIFGQKMLISTYRKSLFAICLSVLRPCITMACSHTQTACPPGGNTAGQATIHTQTSVGTGDSGSVYAGLYSIAYVTVPNVETGKTLAHGLVEKQLAACVNIIPQIISMYKWDGKINEDPEALLMLKTRTEKVDEVTAFVKANHPYEVCEVISAPIQNGNPAYLRWIGESVADCPGRSPKNEP